MVYGCIDLRMCVNMRVRGFFKGMILLWSMLEYEIESGMYIIFLWWRGYFGIIWSLE